MTGARLICAAALVLAGCAGPGGDARDQLVPSVQRDLRGTGIDVDANALSTGQLSTIHKIAHSDNSESEKRGLISSTIGGRESLRGTFGG